MGRMGERRKGEGEMVSMGQGAGGRAQENGEGLRDYNQIAPNDLIAELASFGQNWKK